MNEIDPSARFSADAVQKFHGEAVPKAANGRNDIARQVASQYRRDTMSPVIVSGVLRLVELGVLFLSGLALYVLYVGVGGALSWHYPTIAFGGSLLAVILLEFGDLYQMSVLLRPARTVGRLLLVWSSAFAALALTGFFLKVSSDFSRIWFGAWFVTGFVLLFGLRLVLSQLIRRWARNGRMERRAVIVGGGKAAESL